MEDTFLVLPSYAHRYDLSSGMPHEINILN